MKTQDIKHLSNKPTSCKFCYWWGGRNKGCVRGENNCYYQVIEKETLPQNECIGCPYGRDMPCIGYCMKRILKDNASK